MEALRTTDLVVLVIVCIAGAALYLPWLFTIRSDGRPARLAWALAATLAVLLWPVEHIVRHFILNQIRELRVVYRGLIPPPLEGEIYWWSLSLEGCKLLSIIVIALFIEAYALARWNHSVIWWLIPSLGALWIAVFLMVA
jgi:hypothetical protein